MKALFDILHPAHAHFFRRAIEELRKAGHEIVVTARDKDITVRLLTHLGISHEVLSAEARGGVGRAGELLARNRRLLGIVRRERPDVMASIAGVSTAPVGFLTRTRNYVFYDTENATLSNILSYPFATAVLTPDCYRARVLGRHIRYAGYHELAYLHPRRFAPDGALLRAGGVDPSEPYSVVRFVSWRALHDRRKQRGFSEAGKQALVAELARYGRVFVTSEDPLPDELAEHRLPVPPHQIHHLMAFARLFVGESSTMASESVLLGTPAIYVDAVGTSPTDELEQRYGLCYYYRAGEFDLVLDRVRHTLDTDVKSSNAFTDRVGRLLREKIDVTDLIVRTLLDFGRT